MSARLDTVRQINDLVNRERTYVSDQEQFGVPEHWQTTKELLGTPLGDCEDFAIDKARRLWDMGFSEYEVVIAAGFVILESGGRSGHAVCLWFEDPRDPWVLDNMRPELLRYSAVRDRLDLWACCNRHEQWRLRWTA